MTDLLYELRRNRHPWKTPGYKCKIHRIVDLCWSVCICGCIQFSSAVPSYWDYQQGRCTRTVQIHSALLRGEEQSSYFAFSWRRRCIDTSWKPLSSSLWLQRWRVIIVLSTWEVRCLKWYIDVELTSSVYHEHSNGEAIIELTSCYGYYVHIMHNTIN